MNTVIEKSFDWCAVCSHFKSFCYETDRGVVLQISMEGQGHIFFQRSVDIVLK